MKLSTSTLGCPEWDLPTIVERVKAYGFHGLELRGIGCDLDITRTEAFTSRLGETKRMFDDVRLEVSCIATSIGICQEDKLENSMEEARRTIPIALEFGTPCVRVFGMGDGDRSLVDLASVGSRTMERIFELDGARQVKWCFETHDHWVPVQDVQLLLNRVPARNFGVLWDVGHTTRVISEHPGLSFNCMKGRVFNTHFKDAVYDTEHPQAMKDGWRYVPLGEGQLPLAEAVEVLLIGGYDGYLTFEHEKRWEPELEPPEQAFPHAVQWFKGRLGEHK